MAITVYVLNCGELFYELFHTVAAFMKSGSYLSLVYLSMAFGFFIAVTRALKKHDPNTIVKWFVMYILIFQIAIIPKTDVVVYDVSTQKTRAISNVPMAFAFVAEALTGLGYGLAQLFDSLFSTPDSIQYSKTGFLFGSKIIQETRNFRVTDPILKADLNMYFKRCVVGNVYVNHVLSPTELKESNNIWESISKSPSKIRRTLVTSETGEKLNLTCAEATPKLKARLNLEIKRSYSIFGINLFGKPKNTKYESLFKTNLQSAFNYYQAIQTTGTNVFLQSMMLNFVKDGVTDYQSYLNSTASIMNQEFTKSQVQQLYAWEIGGLKAAWVWPFFHSVLMFLCLALFPLILLFVIGYNGLEALKSYYLLFFSIQLWPVCFAVLNFVMSFYGKTISSSYGAINLANLDSITQLHSQVGSVAGYMMIFIPWLSYGLLTKIGEAFNSLSQSMVSGLQNSTMAAASEAASASFSLGQTSFYNATGNTLSANKHDTNFSSLSGNTTRMLDSGATVTKNLDGTEVVDASGLVSKGTTSISSSNAISGMLNDAAEKNSQAISSKSNQLSSLVSEGISRLTQFSELTGKDMRLGDGVSESDSAQVQHAASNVIGVASNIAEKTGTSREQALTGIMNASVTAQAGINSNRSLVGKAAGYFLGADGSLYARTGYEKSDSTAQRSHDGFDKVLDAKEMEDFRNDFSYMQNFNQTHHLDASTSKGASLLSQAAGDLRQAQNLSQSLDANYSEGERISRAKSVTESGGASINQNLDQMFQEYVTDKVGRDQRNYLYGHPGDANAQAKLSNLANGFLSDEGMRNRIIDTYGNSSNQINPKAHYQSSTKLIESEGRKLQSSYSNNSKELSNHAENSGVIFNEDVSQSLKNKVLGGITDQQHATQVAGEKVSAKSNILGNDLDENLLKGRIKSDVKGLFKGEK